MRRRIIALAVVPAFLAPALVAPPVQAAPDQVSVMQDDDLLLYRSDAVRVRTLQQMKKLGADAVRVTVLWRIVAENARLSNAEISKLKGKARDRARTQRRRFRAENPKTYPTRNWDRYDNLVRDANRNNLSVLFNVTGPGPTFAHRKAPASQRRNAITYKPEPAEYGKFVQAVSARYTGRFRDENGLRTVPLPRVDGWTLWNEPNQAGWLSPQWERRDGQIVPAAPALYRKLYLAGRTALDRTGHGGDRIFLGELAPSGSTGNGARSSLRPVPFMRELVCVGANGAPFAGADATRRDCDDFSAGPLRATGFAHHPYAKGSAPTVAPKSPDDISIANIKALGPLLDALSRQSGGKIPTGMPLFLTEFGYESNPPDPRNGIAPAKQAEFNQLADFLAYNDPRVRAVTQFLLRDAGPLKQHPKGSRLYWFTFQSGLFTQNGKPKLAAIAYSMPFVIFPQGPGTIGYWGQMRYRSNGSQDVVQIQWRPAPSAAWQPIANSAPTDLRNNFTGTAPVPGPGGEYRAAFLAPATGKLGFASLPAKP